MKTFALLHIARLARRLNAAAEAAEAEKGSPFLGMVKDLKELGEAGYKFLLLAGILPTVAYLIVSVRFYPAGVTIGDSFFFLMVGLAFGLAYALFLTFTIAVAFLLEQLFTGPAGTWKWQLRLIVIGLLLWMVVELAAISHKEEGQLIIQALVGFGFSGFIIVLFKPGLKALKVVSAPSPAPAPTPIPTPTPTPTPTPAPSGSGSAKVPNKLAGTRSLDIALWLTALLAPLVAASLFVQKLNENVAMTNVGLRSMDVTLKLSEENYNILASAAGGQYLAALGCSTASGAPERLVHGVNLLWHGIGERSLVEIPAGEGKPLVVELKREGVFFFRNYHGVMTRCLEMNGDIFFKSGSPQLAEDDSGDLDEMMKVIHKNSASIEEIQVVGHADAFGYKGGAKLNNELALARAATIRDQIVERACFKNVKAEGHGAREPKTLCKDWPVKDTLSECLAVNRRVEVRMKFKPSTPNRPSAA
jgi:outer membrane protein OmpA-like peptidoglycan-associated protein